MTRIKKGGDITVQEISDAAKLVNNFSCSGFLSTIRSYIKVSPKLQLVAHVAIVAALVCAVFIAVVNTNFIALAFVGLGILGEAYFVYRMWKQNKSNQQNVVNEPPPTPKSENTEGSSI